MTTPQAIGGIGIGASILGGFTQAQGAAQMGAAQQQMYNYQAGVAQINAQIARQNAEYQRRLGDQQAMTYGISAAAQEGQIKAAQGASGLDVNSGSAVQVQKSQAQLTSMDLDTIRSNAAKTAYDYDVQSIQFENQVPLYQMAGASAEAAANLNVESSILGTVSSVSSKWLAGSQMGMFGGSSPSTSSSSSPSVFGTLY